MNQSAVELNKLWNDKKREKYKTIMFMVDPGLKVEMQERSAKLGLSVSAYLRTLVIMDITKNRS